MTKPIVIYPSPAIWNTPLHKGRVPKGIITLIQDQKYEVNAYARIDRGIKAIDLYAFAFQFGAFHIIV